MKNNIKKGVIILQDNKYKFWLSLPKFIHKYFIKTYENLRKFLIYDKSIITLIQMAKGAFFKEATVDICSFVIKNSK